LGLNRVEAENQYFSGSWFSSDEQKEEIARKVFSSDWVALDWKLTFAGGKLSAGKKKAHS